MKVIGVIVEYNPLHNGHVYHIQEIKKQTKADIIIAILSTTFTMRGDLSLFDKFIKAKQALQNQIDVVIELPMCLAMQKADIFAGYAVEFLHLAQVDEIWIGSEQNNPQQYKDCLQVLKENENDIQEQLKLGYSYKKITQDLFPLSSNDVLGYAYYKTIREKNYPIELRTILRKNSNYLDKEPTHDEITSALSIRNDLSKIAQYTPDFISQEKDKILNEQQLFPFLKYKILTTSTEDLKKLFFVDEGLEHKLKDIYSYSSFEEFIAYLTTKRYTSTRIKRMLIYVLCNIKKEEINIVMSTPIDYLRVLGYSEKGKKYLSSIKKEVKLYSNIKEGLTPALDIELKVSKLIDVVYKTNLLNKEQGAPILK